VKGPAAGTALSKGQAELADAPPPAAVGVPASGAGGGVVKSVLSWLVFFGCAYVFSLFVNLGGNFFGLSEGVVKVLFAANLTVFMYLLARFVGRPMASFLHVRREGIAEQLERAQRKLAEAEALRAEVRERLDRVEQEMAQLTERARREGQAEAEEIAVQTARDEERMLRRVEEEIQRRQAEARHNLARETAELTAQLTREVLASELSDADRRRVMERNLAAMRAVANEE